MIDKARFPPHYLVILLAAAAVTNSQLAAFFNPYLINGDVFQITYWMRQFRDPALFQDDLLTVYAKYFHTPWGFVLVYRVLSPFVDALVVGKILTFVLFVVSSLYLFKLVHSFADTYTAFVAVLLYRAANLLS
jgi:hypothetical protein